MCKCGPGCLHDDKITFFRDLPALDTRTYAWNCFSTCRWAINIEKFLTFPLFNIFLNAKSLKFCNFVKKMFQFCLWKAQTTWHDIQATDFRVRQVIYRILYLHSVSCMVCSVFSVLAANQNRNSHSGCPKTVQEIFYTYCVFALLCMSFKVLHLT